MRYFVVIIFWLFTIGVQGQTRSMHIADSLFSAFNYAAAASLFTRLQGGNDSVAVFRRLAQCYHKQGDYQSEGRTLLRIPADSLTHNDMRQLYYAHSNTQDSVGMETWGRRILQLYPYDADITASVAADLMQKNKVEKALLLTKRYLKTDTTNLNVWRQYAYSCYLMGDYGEALRSYLRLYRHGWKSFEVSFILGICYGEMNDAGNAYDHLVRANQMKNGRDVLVLKLLAKNCMKIGMPKKSAEYMEQAIERCVPDSVTMFGMYNSLAEAYFYLRDYGHAIAAFQKASKCQPENAITYYNIAQMYSGLKDPVGMANYYKLFLRHSSTLKDTEDNREMIERARAFVKKQK